MVETKQSSPDFSLRMERAGQSSQMYLRKVVDVSIHTTRANAGKVNSMTYTVNWSGHGWISTEIEVKSLASGKTLSHSMGTQVCTMFPTNRVQTRNFIGAIIHNLLGKWVGMAMGCDESIFCHWHQNDTVENAAYKVMAFVLWLSFPPHVRVLWSYRLLYNSIPKRDTEMSWQILKRQLEPRSFFHNDGQC